MSTSASPTAVFTCQHFRVGPAGTLLKDRAEESSGRGIKGRLAEGAALVAVALVSDANGCQWVKVVNRVLGEGYVKRTDLRPVTTSHSEAHQQARSGSSHGGRETPFQSRGAPPPTPT